MYTYVHSFIFHSNPNTQPPMTIPATPPPAATDSNRVWIWYHSTLATYGSWLPGDPRGHRTRRHREHVEGDYKNRPEPGAHGRLEQVSRQTLKQPPAVLSATFRRHTGRALLQRLERVGAWVVTICVASQHAHVLAKMPVESPNHWLGQAKRHAWFELRDRGWQGKLWAKGCRNERVRDRAHQLNLYHYILRHAEQGAWVWKWGDER